MKELAQQIKIDIPAVFLAIRRRETHFAAKILAVITIIYVFSPIDLIPDFIPIIWFLDDMILLIGMTTIVLKIIPAAVFEQCRKKAAELWLDGKLKMWYCTLPIIFVRLLVIFVIARIILNFVPLPEFFPFR